ncbi:MAG TPA: hypothetical protein VMV04_16145 [Thermodesulfobacteriota bacterium]|nr:hypothetical protein [Thermodesulfobacteriota bacterium]
MKKIVCIIAVVLMIATAVYAQKKMAITAKDLPGMKGIWEGMLTFGVFEAGGSSACTLEILNDTVPVKTILTVRNVPDIVAQTMGVESGKNVFENDSGKLSSMGTLVFSQGGKESFVEISKLGDKKINLSYWYKGLRGEGTFKKK